MTQKIASLYNQMYKCKSLKRHEVYSHQYIESIMQIFKRQYYCTWRI